MSSSNGESSKTSQRAAEEMPSYYPVVCCRSDGKTEVSTKTGSIERNQPTEKQLKDTPDARGHVDCYRKLDDKAEKSLDWRRKLGGMLRDLLDPKNDKNYILREFPDGYQLYEHVKYTENVGGDEKKKDKGRHAAGTYERQDAYLYGHPDGRKKRFRSPADFFPHLLWLVVDKEGDPLNCSCKLCAPDGDRDTIENVVKEPKQDPDDKQPRAKKDTKTDLKSAPLSSVAAPKTTQSIPTPSSAAPTSSRTTQVPRPTNTKSQEQLSDGDPNSKYLYRPGELVWFNNEPNWRLGVIGKRGLANYEPRYLIQPLSNPLQHQQQQIKESEASLRPWLAWSVPSTTNPSLNEMTFEQIPWVRVVAGEFDNGRKADYVVDGSILAAKMIDASYSLFERKENALAGPGEVHYNGMFLGAEKIWVGEPVRLRVPPKPVLDIVVMVIQKLIERTTQGRSSVTFVGDVYKFVEMPSHYTDRSQWPTPDLPPRMIADLRFRNETAENAGTNTWYEWRLLEPAARKELVDVRGRWYETRTLLPVLRGPAKYQEDQIVGKLGDAGEWMNSRRDNNKLLDQRKKNRRDTLGLSVPAEFKISRGLDGPPNEDVFPDQDPLSGQQPFDAGNPIDQFMDLDGVGGQEYYA